MQLGQPRASVSPRAAWGLSVNVRPAPGPQELRKERGAACASLIPRQTKRTEAALEPALTNFRPRGTEAGSEPGITARGRLRKRCHLPMILLPSQEGLASLLALTSDTPEAAVQGLHRLVLAGQGPWGPGVLGLGAAGGGLMAWSCGAWTGASGRPGFSLRQLNCESRLSHQERKWPASSVPTPSHESAEPGPKVGGAEGQGAGAAGVQAP